MSVWMVLCAAALQVACDEEDGAGASDAGPDTGPDSSGDSSDGVHDGGPDVTGDASYEDAPTEDLGDFPNYEGNYTPSDNGCGIAAGFELTTDDGIVVNPFGQNGAVEFTLKSGSSTVCEASGLTIFGQGAHDCSITASGGSTLKLECSNANGGSCQQSFAKAPAGGTCVPAGPTGTEPTQPLSPTSAYYKGEVFLPGISGQGTQTCWTIDGKTYPSTGSYGNRFIIPAGIAPGSYTVSIAGPGWTTQKQLTVAPGEAPNATATTPASAGPGTEITISGGGLDGFGSTVVVAVWTSGSISGPPTQSANATVTSSTATELKLTVPNLPAGAARVDLYKSGCGLGYATFTIP